MLTKTGVKLGNQLNLKENLHSRKCHEPQHLWLMHRCGKSLKNCLLDAIALNPFFINRVTDERLLASYFRTSLSFPFLSVWGS